MSHILDAKALDSRRFDQPRLDALFEAILVNDIVDPETPLPHTVTLDWDQALLVDAYRLSRQLWVEGVDRAALIGLIERLGRERDLSDADRLAFKYARAKYKHLRFAHALIDRQHRYPILLDWMTTALGHLQDAFKTRHRARVWRVAKLNLFLLSAGPQVLLRREIDRLDPDSPAGFRVYTLCQIGRLRGMLSRATITGAQFHATRKIASRQVGFYTDILTLRPDEDVFRMTRAWAAINGLMGSMHDELVERRVAGTQDYHREHFRLPDAIGERLRAILALYPKA